MAFRAMHNRDAGPLRRPVANTGGSRVARGGLGERTAISSAHPAAQVLVPPNTRYLIDWRDGFKTVTMPPPCDAMVTIQCTSNVQQCQLTRGRNPTCHIIHATAQRAQPLQETILPGGCIAFGH